MRKLGNTTLITAVIAVLIFVTNAHAMMGNGSSSEMVAGPMMTANGSFGMMNGMTAGPVVGDDGTAYFVSFNPTANPGTAPSSDSFQSNLLAVTTTGTITSITMKGIVSRPVVVGNNLVATASLPDFTDFTMVRNFGTNPSSGQSVLYVVTLPISSSTKPLAVSLDGDFASVPVIANDKVYVVTTDYGNGMMAGNNTFNMMFGSQDSNIAGTAKTYLYVINFDGTLASKTLIQ